MKQWGSTYKNYSETFTREALTKSEDSLLYPEKKVRFCPIFHEFIIGRTHQKSVERKSGD